ncbi:acyl-CoA N-acyltransferase, partial [Lentinus tigrinus ALCF2SS1-6]
IGVVYVTMSSIPREVHVGISVLPPYRSRGCGMQACALAVQWAIETIDAHRVQARIMTSPSRESAQRLFTALGFAHEGIQRRAVIDAEGAWADITHMGIVDVDWIVRKRRRAAPRNLWDELFERHQREREELLRWEANEGVPGPRIRRTSSMETVR